MDRTLTFKSKFTGYIANRKNIEASPLPMSFCRTLRASLPVLKEVFSG
jgi:hypothetical protein